MAVSEQGKRSVIYGRRDSPSTELRSTARPEPDNNSYLETDVVNKFASRQSDPLTGRTSALCDRGNESQLILFSCELEALTVAVQIKAYFGIIKRVCN